MNKIKEKIKNCMKKTTDFIEKKYKVFFILIFIIALILNTYKLGIIPSGVNCDEAGMTYDAYAIANYGTDRFQNKYPVYFTNFGDGQNALYTYLTSILIKVFGNYNTLIIRVPALIISMAEVVISYLLVKQFRSKKESLLFMFLVTISPWHIMKSRWGLESYLLSPFLLFSIFALVKAIKDEKYKILKYVISGILFGITLYTYAISYIVIPLFLSLMLIYLIVLKKVKVKEVIALAIPLCILALPLVLVQLVQKDIIKPIYSFITIQKLFKYRVGELSLAKFSENLGTLKYALFCDRMNYNSIKGFGTLYYIGTISMIAGLINIAIKYLSEIIKRIKNSVKEKEYNKDKKENKENKDKKELNLDIIMLLMFISNFIITILTDMNANKLNGIFISATYFELVTLRSLYKYNKLSFNIIIITYVLYFVLFIKSYLVVMDYNYKPCFDNGAVCAFEDDLLKNTNKKIYGDNILYIYKLYANPISPEEFNKDVVFKNNRVVGFGNYEEIYLNTNNIDENAIYLTYNQYKASELENRGFKIKKFNYCYVIYKE